MPTSPSATPRQAAVAHIDAARQRPSTSLGRLVSTDPDPRVVGVDADQALALFTRADAAAEFTRAATFDTPGRPNDGGT